jgi:hypothetical protein
MDEPKTGENGRNDAGRFLPGCAAGPGRGRRKVPTEAEEALFEQLRETVNENFTSRPGTTWRDVMGALVRLTRRARERLREEE